MNHTDKALDNIVRARIALDTLESRVRHGGGDAQAVAENIGDAAESLEMTIERIGEI